MAPEQFGFRKGISTENSPYKLTESTFESVNKKRHVGGIFCNLFKLFDCVYYEILLDKLHFYRLQGTGAYGSDPNG